MKPYIVAITGASGILYGVRLLQTLAAQKIPVEFVISDTARIVAKEELGIDLSGIRNGREICERLGSDATTIHFHDFKDFSAPIASGSYPTEGMVVVPCSMGTLGRIAHGYSEDVLLRAADVVLKEKKKLILVPRETPLNLIHVKNFELLIQAGATILPANPSFYTRPQSVEQVVDTVVARVLDHLGVAHQLVHRWKAERE